MKTSASEPHLTTIKAIALLAAQVFKDTGSSQADTRRSVQRIVGSLVNDVANETPISRAAAREAHRR